MILHGKKYRAVLEKVKKTLYTLAEASALIKEISPSTFDATVEVHVRLNLDPKRSDQQLRTTVALPHGTGKTKRIVAFVNDEDIKGAKEAGVIEAGNITLIDKVKDGWTEFDVAIAHPDLMKDLAKIGKILGTKGLMPNPKAGTVSADIVKTVKELMAGRVEIKLDPSAIVHTVAGKISFDAKKIEENVRAVIEAINTNRPNGVKGVYIKSIALASTMGPGLNIDLSEGK